MSWLVLIVTRAQPELSKVRILTAPEVSLFQKPRLILGLIQVPIQLPPEFSRE
jgi:hypothetical protein